MILRLARWLHRRLCRHEDLVVETQAKPMALHCWNCGKTIGPVNSHASRRANVSGWKVEDAFRYILKRCGVKPP